MDEASLCDRVALIQHGKILSVDRPQAIVDQYDKPLLAVRTDRVYQLIQDLREFPATHSVFPFGEYVHLATVEPVWQEAIEGFLLSRGHTGVEIRPATVTIEDCFMELMMGGRD
jgi:ABC-2 type transport system ATP-binding protein